jgi:cysteine-rich repeat protein
MKQNLAATKKQLHAHATTMDVAVARRGKDSQDSDGSDDAMLSALRLSEQEETRYIARLTEAYHEALNHRDKLHEQKKQIAQEAVLAAQHALDTALATGDKAAVAQRQQELTAKEAAQKRLNEELTAEAAEENKPVTAEEKEQFHRMSDSTGLPAPMDPEETEDKEVAVAITSDPEMITKQAQAADQVDDAKSALNAAVTSGDREAVAKLKQQVQVKVRAQEMVKDEIEEEENVKAQVDPVQQAQQEAATAEVERVKQARDDALAAGNEEAVKQLEDGLAAKENARLQLHENIRADIERRKAEETAKKEAARMAARKKAQEAKAAKTAAKQAAARNAINEAKQALKAALASGDQAAVKKLKAQVAAKKAAQKQLQKQMRNDLKQTMDAAEAAAGLQKKKTEKLQAQLADITALLKQLFASESLANQALLRAQAKQAATGSVVMKLDAQIKHQQNDQKTAKQARSVLKNTVTGTTHKKARLSRDLDVDKERIEEIEAKIATNAIAAKGSQHQIDFQEGIIPNITKKIKEEDMELSNRNKELVVSKGALKQADKDVKAVEEAYIIATRESQKQSRLVTKYADEENTLSALLVEQERMHNRTKHAAYDTRLKHLISKRGNQLTGQCSEGNDLAYVDLAGCDASTELSSDTRCKNTLEDGPSAWYSRSAAGSWIEVEFNKAHALSSIKLKQSEQEGDWVHNVTLSFSDKSTQALDLRQEQDLQTYEIEPVGTTMIKIEVASTVHNPMSVGFTRLECYETCSDSKTTTKDQVRQKQIKTSIMHSEDALLAAKHVIMRDAASKGASDLSPEALKKAKAREKKAAAAAAKIEGLLAKADQRLSQDEKADHAQAQAALKASRQKHQDALKARIAGGSIHDAKALVRHLEQNSHAFIDQLHVIGHSIAHSQNQTEHIARVRMLLIQHLNETATKAASAAALDNALSNRVGEEGRLLGDADTTENLLSSELSKLRDSLWLSREAGIDAHNRGNETLHSARLRSQKDRLDLKLANISGVLMRTSMQQEQAQAAVQAAEQDYEQLLAKQTQSKVTLIAAQAAAATAAEGAEHANKELQKIRSDVSEASLRHRIAMQAQSEQQLAKDVAAAGRPSNSSEPITELDKAVSAFPTHIPDYQMLNQVRELQMALDDAKERELRAVKFANSQEEGKQSTQLIVAETEIQHVAAERAVEECKARVDKERSHEQQLLQEHQMAAVAAKELETERNATVVELDNAECVVSEWSSFTDCPIDRCVHAHEQPVRSSRTRAVVTLPNTGGNCPVLEEYQPCSRVELCADCGDGFLVAAEQCDDGNLEGGDGCSAECEVETSQGWSCEGGSASSSSRCFECGDGIRQAGEQCDDDNREADDGCSPSCRVEPDYICASVSELSPYVCSKQDKYRTNILRGLKDMETKCSLELENKVFVAMSSVDGAGECQKAPGSPVPGMHQIVQERLSIAGPPLSKAPLAMTQITVSLNPIEASTVAAPTMAPTVAPTEDFAAEGSGSVSLVMLGEGASESSLAVCRTTRTVVCGIAATQANSIGQNTACVDTGNTYCDEVCVRSSTNCDLEAGGQVVYRPYLNWLSSLNPEVCCYPQCKVPAHVTNVSVSKFCAADEYDVLSKAGAVEDDVATDDDSVVTLLDDSPTLDDSSTLGASNNREPDHIESVGPFQFVVWKGNAPTQQSEAFAKCVVVRTQQCQPTERKLLQSDDTATVEAGTAVNCTSVAHAKCKEVTGPKSLCEGDFGGELIQKAGETICSFKDCKTPSNWANQMGGQIRQDAWCYVKNIQYGANFVSSTSQTK